MTTMLGDINDAIRRLLYERGGIPADEVDIRFETPTKQWVDSLARPTLCLFMFDMRENAELRRGGMQAERTGNRAVFRMAPRRFDLRYLISALSSAAGDEQLLIWRTLATLLRYPEIPAELMPDALREAAPTLTGNVGKAEDGPRPHDLWGALELPPRPALIYSVTAPLDLEVEFETPLVLTRTIRYTRRAPGDEAAGAAIRPSHVLPVGEQTRIGGVVRNRDGAPLADVTVGVEGSAVEAVTGADGRFALRGVRPGPLTLLVAAGDAAPQSVIIEIPSDSYDIVLE